MKHSLLNFFFFILLIIAATNANAKLIFANPSNYLNYLNTLSTGDTLSLAPGIYINNLRLNGINGSITQPIVIMGSGSSTNFQAQACCNTVSITQCSYIIIKNLKLDGMHVQVDAVKAEGTTGNWAHHITLEYLNIINYDGDQQNVGISTKCSAWNWIIRKNKLEKIGTGMYLGNSDGDKPFVNGIIEYNFIANTIGYNIEIKHQLNGVRDAFPGTAVNGKTIIRHNVFTKDETSSTGGNARPNLLVGGFPSTGWGSTDYYEIYGNFFFNNPVEALFQGTGNVMLYENIFVNHYDPSGIRAVYLTPQNGVSPQDVKVFHNTVWVANSSGGIRLYNANSSYKQYCYSNAVFSPSPITNFTESKDNITDSYANAGNYVFSANANISKLDLYPKAGQLKDSLTSDSIFHGNSNWDIDFNKDKYDWTYRGAYSGCCLNTGWQLQLDTIATKEIVTSVNHANDKASMDIYPNPVSTILYINQIHFIDFEFEIYDVMGITITSGKLNEEISVIDFENKPNGVYFLIVRSKGIIIAKKFIKQ